MKITKQRKHTVTANRTARARQFGIKAAKVGKTKRRYTVKASKSAKRKKCITASGFPYTKWVFDGDDGQWKMWGGSYKSTVDNGFLDAINHTNYPNPEYNVENNYTDVVVLQAGETPDDGRPVKANSCTSAKNIYAEDKYYDEYNTRFEREQFAEIIVHEIEDEYSIKISDDAWGMIMDLAADLSFGADAHKHGSDPMWVLEDTIYDIFEEDTGVVIGSSKISRNVVTAAQADTTVSAEDVDELVLYITNDGDLYRGRASSIIKNLKRKANNGNYDKELTVKAWQYLADDGVRKYDKEFGSGRGSVTWLNPATRKAIATELTDYYEDEIFYDDSVTSAVATNHNSSRTYDTDSERDAEYLNALGKGVVKDLTQSVGDTTVHGGGNFIYEISDSAITFMASGDGTVLYIQPLDLIEPNMDDLETDIEKLCGTIYSEIMPKF